MYVGGTLCPLVLTPNLKNQIPPERFDISPPRLGDAQEGLDAFRFSFKPVKVTIDRQKPIT